MLAAREVEWCAELARQFGFRFPKEYDLGITVTLPNRSRFGLFQVRVHLRLADIGADAVVSFNPGFDDDERWLDLARQAHTLIPRWLDAHADAKPSPEVAQRLLDATADEGELMSRVRTAVAKARFEAR